MLLTCCANSFHVVPMPRIIPTPGLAMKIVVVLDIIGTLMIEQIGFTFSLPAYHPAMLAIVLVMTYALFRWRDEIAVSLIELTHPFSDGLHKKAAGELAGTVSAPVQILAHGLASMHRDFEDVKESMHEKKIRSRALSNLRK